MILPHKYFFLLHSHTLQLQKASSCVCWWSCPVSCHTFHCPHTRGQVSPQETRISSPCYQLSEEWLPGGVALLHSLHGWVLGRASIRITHSQSPSWPPSHPALIQALQNQEAMISLVVMALSHPWPLPVWTTEHTNCRLSYTTIPPLPRTWQQGRKWWSKISLSICGLEPRGSVVSLAHSPSSTNWVESLVGPSELRLLPPILLEILGNKPPHNPSQLPPRRLCLHNTKSSYLENIRSLWISSKRRMQITRLLLLFSHWSAAKSENSSGTYSNYVGAQTLPSMSIYTRTWPKSLYIGAPHLQKPLSCSLKRSRVNLCINYLALKQITINNQYPVPLIPELLDQQKMPCITTKLNFCGASNLVWILTGDEWKTALKNLIWELWIRSYALQAH